jgi:hypothetical protein
MSPTEKKMQPAIHQVKNPDIYRFDVRLFVAMYWWVAFSIPSGSLFLVNHPVFEFHRTLNIRSFRDTLYRAFN